MSGVIFDLFAGPGGWDEGLRLATGRTAIGVEYDKTACDTALANGHQRLLADVSALDPAEVLGEDELWGLIASPPCQAFSMAGKGRGRDDAPQILQGVQMLASGQDPRDTLLSTVSDPRSVLALEPLRWALELEPEWMAWEQVPPVQPLWDACAEVLRADGYSVWTGNLQAEQYGVPQTRKRAVLMASRTRQVQPPTPTHSRFYPRNPTKLDPGVRKWVSMAEALGWGMTARPSTTVTGGGTDSGGGVEVFGNGGRQRIATENQAGRWSDDDIVGFPRRVDPGRDSVELDGVAYRERDLRMADCPANTVTEKIRSWARWQYVNGTNVKSARRDLDQPAPTVHFGERLNSVDWQFVGGPQSNATSRELTEPAPTVFSQRTENMRWKFSGPGPGSTAGIRERDPDTEPASTITGAGSAQWVVSTGANSHTVGPEQREGTDWREVTKGYERSVDAPAPTVDGKAGGAWKVHPAGERAEAVAAGREDRQPEWQPTAANEGTDSADMQWTGERPSPTIVGSFKPEVVAAPGYRKAGDGPRQNAKGSVRVSITEAAVLQSFRPDFIWIGSRTAQYRQVGDAVPPLLAAHVLAGLCDPITTAVEEAS